MSTILKAIIVFTFMFSIIHAQSNDDNTNRILADYENIVIQLQEAYHVPSISIAIVSNKKIIYSNGFGFADIENQIAAAGSTPYRIASITKPVASTIILKLVESGTLQLDDTLKECWPGYLGYFSNLKTQIMEQAPQYISLIENYHFEASDITLRQQLSHTCEGPAGENFKYSGFLYSQLSNLVDTVSDKSFYSLVKELILQCDMNNSLPQQSDTWRPHVTEKLAKPYFKGDHNEPVLGTYPNPDLGAGAGIVASAIDLAKFDIALDSDQLISAEMREAAFTPATVHDGREIQYGLGWFIGKYKNYKVVYHTGWQPSAYSGLYVKVIDKDVSLILLANSEDLIAPFMNGLGEGQIEASPFAKGFLDLLLK